LANLLITGGAGFIGSHTTLVLLEAGHQLGVLDSYANSSPGALRRVDEVAGPGAAARLQVIEGDICSEQDLGRAFAACSAQGRKPVDADRGVKAGQR
jgi:UDP-glucose 4-epimerase